MEESKLIQILQDQAYNDYLRWLRREIYDASNLYQTNNMDLPANEVMTLLDKLTREIPTKVDHSPIYCACVLSRSFNSLQNRLNQPPELQVRELEILFRFSKIYLNVGCYSECIECCNLCLKEQNTPQLTPELHIEVLFARSKAFRNLGEYEHALDDLRDALYIVNQNPAIGYLKGAVLVRIGKVYSQFLVMMSVSLCFLNEARDQLEPFLKHKSARIREKANQEYAICLDSIGQYWKQKGDCKKAVDWFQKAQKINEELERTAGIFRTESHIIMTIYPELLRKSEREDELDQMINSLQYIVRKLGDDHANQRGLAVRYLHLSEIQARRGHVSNAQYSMSESKKMAQMYRDDKTLIKQKISDLQYDISQGGIDWKELRETLELAKLRKYYGYEINLHEAIIDVIHQGRLPKDKLLNSLSRSRTLYLQLSNIAQETIQKISNNFVQPNPKNEFFCLSESNSKELLVKVVSDYDLFIQKMNEIIDQLLEITDQRSKDLNKAILAEAKASLASGILHDLKHILASTEGETCLDTVLEKLKQGYSKLSQENLHELIDLIQMVNQNLREKIFPRIREATRVPNDFNREINVYDIFAEVCQLQMGKKSDFLTADDSNIEIRASSQISIEINCPEQLTIIYNREIFFNLIKEMYRNALDYQRQTRASVTSYIMEAKNRDGEVEISILTQFQDKQLAQKASMAISKQLGEENVREDGFGIRALRGFIQFKTGGACTASVINDGTLAGICFSVPRK